MGASHRRASRVAAGAFAAVCVAPLIMAAPALAESESVACHWINREFRESYVCEESPDSATPVSISDCWQFPAPANTRIRLKTADGWIKAPTITVDVSGTKGCSKPYRYRTLVQIPRDLVPEGVPMRIRMIMPASSGVLPNGKTYDLGRTSLIYAACLVSTESGEACLRR